MSILSTFKKYKDYILTSNGYQLSSRWTKSDAVVMGDGTDDTNTLEKNLGSIQGITDSLTATSSNVALSAAGGNNLQSQIDTLNSNLTSVKNYSTEETVVGTWIDGKPIYRKCYVGTPNLSDTTVMTPYTIPNSINCNNIDTLVNLSTHYRGSSLNGIIAPFTYYRLANVAATYDIDASGIRLFRNGQAIYSYVVIVEYTKA